MADEPRTYTQEEVEKLLEERTAGLKANRDELAKEAKTAKAKLAAYDGLDPEEHKRLKAAAEEAERKKAEAQGDYKALEKQLTEKYEGLLAAVRTEKAEILSAMESHLIDAAAVAELAKHTNSPRLLLPHVKGVMKVVKEDGQYQARIIDPLTGAVRIGGGQGASPMTLPELIESMKRDNDFADAFKGTGSSGGGAAKSSAGGGGGAQVIAAGDNAGFIANLKDIAAGKVEVRTP